MPFMHFIDIFDSHFISFHISLRGGRGSRRAIEDSRSELSLNHATRDQQTVDNDKWVRDTRAAISR